MDAELTLSHWFHGYIGTGILSEERMAKRKWGKEAKLTSIMQFPPQQTIIMFLMAAVDKKLIIFYEI